MWRTSRGALGGNRDPKEEVTQWSGQKTMGLAQRRWEMGRSPEALLWRQ